MFNLHYTLLFTGDVMPGLGCTALTDPELFNFHFHSESEKKDNPLAFRRLLFYKEQTFILLNKEF